MAVLVALLVVSSTVATVYFGQYQQVSSQNQRHMRELDAALASYAALSGSYNASLSDYNRTLSLLTSAVANLNTSLPAYRNASLALSSLWNSYQSLAARGGSDEIAYEAHMLMDYGNGTRQWYNGTRIQPGWNAYIATMVLLDGNVQATWYPQYGEHYVSGLQGVSDTTGDFWFLLTYNKTTSWQVAQVGADDVPIFNGTVFAWAYCPENADYFPVCSLL